jgi:adenine-specific DNA-methyltransferase
MSDKMKFETPNITAENVAKIAALFPGVVTEGKVNIDLLRSMLGEDVFTDEAYEFTWVGKRAAITEAGRPIRKTLRPAPDESKDWDTTENLYIEGDNLDVLKLLQESYLGKVKMVYIDPPYNTGSDFVYRDNFTTSREEYDEETGVYDEEGDRLFKNTETNGRFHSDWCSMIYPRLVLARNLLRDDGVIFISIDDNEVNNIRKLCDEIFGESKFIAQLIWKRRASSAMADNNVSTDHEYVIVYQKGTFTGFTGYEKDFKNYSNPDNDPRGPWVLGDLTVGMTAAMRPNQAYNLVDPKTGNEYPFNPNRVWTFIPETMNKMISEGRIVFPKDSTKRPMQKRFQDTLKSNHNPFPTLMLDKVGLNTEATRKMQEVMGGNVFDYSKPLSLLTTLIAQITKGDDIILDFFSGSASTAHAVMQLNAEDDGKRRFIMVQLPEVCAGYTEAAKAGFSTICEIGKERIRRAGDKIKAEVGLTAPGLDIGFRVLKLADTNMNDVYYAAGDYTQDMISLMEGNIKSDRTDMDLLFGCLLDWGLPLSMPHTHEKIDGFTVHTYNGGDLIACFDENINETAIREIASRKPLRAVFRDSSFTSSPEKINVFEIFKLLAPNTNVRVI